MTAVDLTRDGDFVEPNRLIRLAVLDESERALDLLERAVAPGWDHSEWIRNGSDRASRHGTPRFRDVPGRIH